MVFLPSMCPGGGIHHVGGSTLVAMASVNRNGLPNMIQAGAHGRISAHGVSHRHVTQATPATVTAAAQPVNVPPVTVKS
jgi:hypothetical protein